MRRAAISILSTIAAFGFAACWDGYGDLYEPLTDPSLAATTTSGTTTTTTIDPGCIPSSTPNPVSDDCGVFVSSSMGSEDGDGSQDKPYATIAKALGSSKTGPIYLCAETFTESVHVAAGQTIYGGLDCAKGWAWSAGKKSEVSPDAGEVPLVVDPQVSVVLADVRLRAKDAVTAGGSSIGLIATAGSDVTLERCDVEAGTGKDGAAGEDAATPASAGTMGNPGADACTAAANIGGLSVTNACDDADLNDDSISGAGGIGQDSSGGAGSAGLPDGAMNGGVGEGASACTNGTVGDNGASGGAATGATGIGSISAQGYTGVAGPDGMKGKPGQGGGGGGGAKGGSGPMGSGKCDSAASAGGASGGSGGSGGCGGAGGKGGQAGGGSIGIVAIGAKLAFDNVKITTSAGGSGGNGGAGQAGGLGGPGAAGGTKGAATALKDACGGGNGGSGGDGGLGGGGLGGPSIGIAYTVDMPSTKGATITIGAAGDGGTGDGDVGAGAKGVAAETQAF